MKSRDIFVYHQSLYMHRSRSRRSGHQYVSAYSRLTCLFDVWLSRDFRRRYKTHSAIQRSNYHLQKCPRQNLQPVVGLSRHFDEPKLVVEFRSKSTLMRSFQIGFQSRSYLKKVLIIGQRPTPCLPRMISAAQVLFLLISSSFSR